MADYDLRIYAKGEAFNNQRYDLRSLEVLVSSYRSILDRLVAVQLGRRKLTPAIKDQIDYDVRVESGSIDFWVNFVLTHKELLGSVALADGGYQLSAIITRLFREAINLREIVAGLIEKGLPININITNNINIGKNNVIVNSENGDVTLTDPKILWAAQVTKYPTDRLVSGVDGKQIEYIEFQTERDEMRIVPQHRSILGQNKEELTATLRVRGRLDMVAFSSHRGTILSENDRFPVRWDEAIRTKVQRVVDVEGVEFVVKPIIDTKRLHSDAIAYHVLDCHIPQGKLGL